MESGTDYPGAFAAPAQSPNAAPAAKILAAADKLNEHELVYASAEGEATPAASAPASHGIFAEQADGQTAAMGAPIKKTLIYKHPLGHRGTDTARTLE